MQAPDDANAPDAATQNLIASIAGILQGTSAAVPTGPLPLGAPDGAPGSPNRGMGSPGGTGAGGINPSLLLLPTGIPLPFPMNGDGLQNLAPYLQLLPGGLGGLGPGGNMPYGLPGIPGMENINLAALLAGGGIDLGEQVPDMGGDPGRKSSKRPNDGSGGGHYKRERSEEGRARESIPNHPHLKGKCHVDGCQVDLTGLSSYYQRYRTCEQHLKAPYILKDGVQQRFCQQCGRFHELHEFDGTKRSCRARLQSHNVRRRKRTEEAMANNPQDPQQQQMQGGGAGGANVMGQAAGMPPLGQMGLQQHGLLQGQLQDLLSQPDFAQLLGMPGLGEMLGAAGLDDANAIATLLSSLAPGLGLGGPVDPSLQLAIQAMTGAGGDQLAPPLLDSLLKSAAAGGMPNPADLGGADLQAHLAMALAQAPAAAASIVGDPTQGMAEAIAAAQAAADAAAAHHAATHGHQPDGHDGHM
ncbi:hypothetical protein HYH03_009756 [Edaphochlamys debaryana]|uniref:SBP-type domain-containing protein n=1 Tax=Edaphochlamys debaryana TaxID=47281 RepID=A0A836BXI1_9CHLO|nr:hypothetical protein HYH03_009756 [Edaphochlamys debaryana]|eukprot:KAG2492027.1 hypothetical protein HYH03_009756 [Edaphochlamys debaryana]